MDTGILMEAPTTKQEAVPRTDEEDVRLVRSQRVVPRLKSGGTLITKYDK